ncbi:hypothetical protein [Nostocoides sp.]
MGGRLLRRWLNQPLLDVAAINRRLDAVQLLHRQHGAASRSARASAPASATWSAGATASSRALRSRATWWGCAKCWDAYRN